MSKSNPIVFLKEMRDSAMAAISFVEGLDKAAFLADDRTKSATAMQLIVIGESANNLSRKHSEFFRQQHHLPWSKMVGIRNRIAHGYFDLNWNAIWDTTKADLPALIDQLNEIIESNERNGES